MNCYAIPPALGQEDFYMSKKEVRALSWKRKDLLDLDDLSAQEIELILQCALPMKEVLSRPLKKLPTLRGKSIALMFYENSTRTRTSFEIAGKILGADITNFSVAQSSVNKGESLLDTAKTLQAMNIDLVIIRHASSGASEFLAKQLRAGVINGGDGQHAHPTQALLDFFTMKERWGDFRGKKNSDCGRYSSFQGSPQQCAGTEKTRC